jgi:hypothetical protein
LLEGILVSAAVGEIDWVYRIFDRRAISVKAKNAEVRKVAAMDLVTNLPFAIEVPAEGAFDDIEVGKEYMASMKVYTARNIAGVTPDYYEFFNVLDVDQSMEDFIKVYWIYPKHIRFDLIEFEPV